MGVLGTVAKGAKAGGRLAKYLLSVPADTGGYRLMNALELAGRLGPDVLFSTMSAVNTPGDLSDKLIVGGTQMLGGTVAGLAAGRQFRNPTLSGVVDTVTSVAGDYASMPVADIAMRGKDKVLGGEGETPYERLGRSQQDQLRQEITQQVLAAYGLLPGTRDQYLRPDPTMEAIGG